MQSRPMLIQSWIVTHIGEPAPARCASGCVPPSSKGRFLNIAPHGSKARRQTHAWKQASADYEDHDQFRATA